MGRRAGRRRPPPTRIAPRSNARQREADYLRHAVDELEKLAPKTGEETALAERRALMMQAEKVAEDLRDAHDVIAGANSPRAGAWPASSAGWSGASAQAPQLIEPAVKALDAALNALEEARAHLEAALRAADFDPRELERIEERLFALRAAGAQIQCAGRRPGGARRHAIRPMLR